jgi:predicted RNase H-like HicB family nuclease
MLDCINAIREGVVIMAASDEHFRRPAWREQLADGPDDNGISVQVDVGVRVPYVVEQDEDGFWCAHAQVRPGVAAFGDGLTREAALDDLRTGLTALLSVVGLHS